MFRLHPVLNALLGLLLLVQAIGVATANGRITVADHAPAGTMEMPCHGDGGHQAGNPDPPSCCGADCPDMTTCALGHFALASTPAVAFAPGTPPRRSLRVMSPPAAIPPSLLRPPISRPHV